MVYNENGRRGGVVALVVPHDEGVLGHDANGIVNMRASPHVDHLVKDYVKSDKSLAELEREPEQEEKPGNADLHYVTHFNWKCPSTVYSLVLIALGVGEWAATVHEMAKFGSNLGTIGAFNFYTIANFGFIMFFHLARKWSHLHTYWAGVAQVFDELPYRRTSTTTKGTTGGSRRGINPGVKIRTVFWMWVAAALGTYPTKIHTGVFCVCTGLLCAHTHPSRQATSEPATFIKEYLRGIRV